MCPLVHKYITAASVGFHIDVSDTRVTIARDTHERQQWLEDECEASVSLALGPSIIDANITGLVSVCLESLVEDAYTGQFTKLACHDVCQSLENTTLFVFNVRGGMLHVLCERTLNCLQRTEGVDISKWINTMHYHHHHHHHHSSFIIYHHREHMFVFLSSSLYT